MRVRISGETVLRAHDFVRGWCFFVGIVFLRFLTNRVLRRRGLWNKLIMYVRYWTVAAGALAGYLYWREIGCVSGVCPITSSPWISTLYGMVIGILLVPKKKISHAGQNETSGSVAKNDTGT